MKNRSVRLLAASLLAGMTLSAAVLACDFGSYWETYKKMFVEWDENKAIMPPQSLPPGVRDFNSKTALGSVGYDWTAVAHMENFSLPVTEQVSFFRDEGLGTFFNLSEGEHHE